jgi:hypothetical protein
MLFANSICALLALVWWTLATRHFTGAMDGVIEAEYPPTMRTLLEPPDMSGLMTMETSFNAKSSAIRKRFKPQTDLHS